MSKEKRRVPKLRFPGFTEDWEQRKLSDITYLSGIKNKENKPYESYSISNEFGFIPQAEQFENGGTMQTADKSMYYIVSQNSFAYNPARINVGSIGYYDKPDNVIVSSLYEVFKTTDIVNDKFLWHWFKSNQFNRLIGKYQEGGVRLYFYYDKLCKGTMGLPAINEQNKISNLLDDLDMYITLHQRKLDNLKLKKKALLQKLFPKNGERYPELRFPGFTDTWEQRKLGECMNSFAYGLNAAAKEYDGMHKYIRITDIDDETHNFIQSNLTSPDIDFNMDVSDYKLNVGDIVFARTGASVGKTYLYNPNDGDLYYAGFLIRGKVKEDCDAGFIYQNTLTKDYDSFIKITSQRSGQPGVNSKEYATFRLNIPCKDEQEQISKVLNSLDELFTLHQRKLDHLQLQKKALLQQIFV